MKWLKWFICWIKTSHKNRAALTLEEYLEHWRHANDSYPPAWVGPRDKFYICRDCQWGGSVSRK